MFFRDPDRDIGKGVVASADEKIREISKLKDKEVGDCTKISTFMNMFNVHVNRIPLDGTVQDVVHISGIHLPAFKKVMRFTTTNYQDNIEGADLTWGDIGGLNEPFSNWKFKYIKTGYNLAVEPKSPFPLTDEDGEVSDQVKYDVGRKFPRIGWTIFPMHVVEAKCRQKHIYAKKTLYFFAYPYWLCTYGIGLMDGYDNKIALSNTTAFMFGAGP